MTKQELFERLRALAESQFFDKGYLQEGLEAYAAMGTEPPPRLFISCGCALWRESRYFEAANAFARAPLELVRDHIKACRVECLHQRQVAHAVAIARIEGICINNDLKAYATDWCKQGYIRDAIAAYQAAGIDIPHIEFKGIARAFQLQGQMSVALDAFEAANAPLPIKDLQEWLRCRPSPSGNPRLELRVLRTLLHQEHQLHQLHE